MAASGRDLFTFDVLDDVLLAHDRGRPIRSRITPGSHLGPVVELMSFCQERGRAVAYEDSEETRAVRHALETRKPVYLDSASAGFVAARRESINGHDRWWDAFMFAMYKSMCAAGFPTTLSKALVGAMDEMQNNIHDHSDAIDTGIVAYRIDSEQVEWTVGDRGIGILNSLRSGVFRSVNDAADALKIALTDGRSRLPVKGRGYGFRELFKALSARSGILRFRSDDQVLTITGVSPTLSRAGLQQRVHVRGFTVTVICAKPSTPD